MGALARFLLILDKLVKSGVINKIPQAIKFAKNEFGEVTPLIKKQIEKVFKTAKKPQVGTPAKKEASITPIREGIETLADAKVADEGSALMDRLTKNIEDAKKPVDLDSTENVRSAIKNLEDQTRLGGDESNIRAALREFLERRLKDGTLNIPDEAERDAIEKVYQGGVDPIDVFRKAYGEDAIIAVSDVFEQFSDEIVRGANNYKELGDNFEKYFRRNRGFYDEVLPVPKEKYGYDEGLMSNQEYADKLRKDLKEKEMLEDFDPTDRTKNANGGIMNSRIALNGGGSPLQKLKQEIVDSMKPYAPGISENRLQAIVKDITLDMSPEEAQASAVSNFQKMFGMATGGRVQLEDGTLNPALMKRMMELMMNPEYRGMSRDQLKKEAESQLMQDSYRSKEGPLLEAKAGGLAGIINL